MNDWGSDHQKWGRCAEHDKNEDNSQWRMTLRPSISRVAGEHPKFLSGDIGCKRISLQKFPLPWRDWLSIAHRGNENSYGVDVSGESVARGFWRPPANRPVSECEMDLDQCPLEVLSITTRLDQPTVHIVCLEIVHMVTLDHGLQLLLCLGIIGWPTRDCIF